MKKIVQAFPILLLSLTVLAQQDTLITEKSVITWVYTKQGNMLKGVLAGRSGSYLLLYPGSLKEKKKNIDYQLVRISFENITITKTKKPNGLVKGQLLGGSIGFAPVIFGEGGAYVAIITFPLGVVAGILIGATSKKKYLINGDYTSFLSFTDKFIKP